MCHYHFDRVRYGLYNWMKANVRAGEYARRFDKVTPDPIELCPSFKFEPGTAKSVADLLQNRYEHYKSVSYRLWVVVERLSELRSIYPPATLHDCDDGSDQNPVRFGQTALGN